MPFRNIVGHARIRGLLASAARADTLPHSLIFSGPDGVGKRLTAIALAQALNCPEAVRAESANGLFDACGKCSSCTRIARGAHADVLMIAPGENGSIKIEQVREMIDRAMYRPFEGRRRVSVIDDAEALVPAAENALLKTLEEPPSSSFFILVTARADALLPTVTSRCSQIRFGRLRSSDVAAVLEHEHTFSKDEARALAAASDGSVGRALRTGSDAFTEAREDAEGLLRAVLARRDPRARIEHARDLAAGSGSAAAEREHLGLRLLVLSSLTRDLGLLGAGSSPELLANIDRRAELESLARSFDRERALDLFTAIDAARDALDRNVSPKVVADWLTLQI